MKTQSEIQDYVERPGRYSNIDGTGEMGIGVMYLGFALLSYLQSILPKDSIWTHNWTGLLFMGVVLLAAAGLGWWGRKAIKKYITYPRTGYIAYNWGAKRSIVSMAVFVVVYAAVSAAFEFLFSAIRHNEVSLPRLSTLILFGASYVIAPFMSKGHPWKWFLALFMTLGLVAISNSVPGGVLDLFRPTMLLVGLTWVASGGITLYLYIRRTHPPAVEPE
jgi:hypothetical protein